MQPQTSDIQTQGQAWDANPIGNPPEGYSSPYANAIRAQDAINRSTILGGTPLPTDQMAANQQTIANYHNTAPSFQPIPGGAGSYDTPAWRASMQNLIQQTPGLTMADIVAKTNSYMANNNGALPDSVSLFSGKPNLASGLAGAMANTTNQANLGGGGAFGAPAIPAGGLAGATGGTTGTSATQTALQQLQAAIGSQQNPLDILQSRESALGIPLAQQQVSGLRQAITNTTNLLNQIAPAVQGRTQNSLVTSAQANKMTQNEQAPVQQNLATLGQISGDAQSGLTNLLGQANSEATMANQGQQQQVTNLQQLYQNVFGQQQASEASRQFNVQQATQAEQFAKNLQLQLNAQQITKDQAAEAQREFDVKQQLAQQAFSQQQAQDQWQHGLDVFNQSMDQQKMQLAAKTASSGSGTSGLASILGLLNNSSTPPTNAPSLAQLYGATSSPAPFTSITPTLNLQQLQAPGSGLTF